MANTYSSLFYHIVFSTKSRIDYLNPDIEKRVWSYVGGIAGRHKMTALQVGGTSNHIHALVMAPPTYCPADIAKFLKGDSSKWIHETFPALRSFAWQDGYGAFAVSKSKLAFVVSYIKNQQRHHHQRTFQEEYLELLRKHEVDFDERYL